MHRQAYGVKVWVESRIDMPSRVRFGIRTSISIGLEYEYGSGSEYIFVVYSARRVRVRFQFKVRVRGRDKSTKPPLCPVAH